MGKFEDERGCVSRYTASSQSAAEVFHSRGYYYWRYVREIHLEECTRYTAVQATAARFHRCPRSPVRDRRLHASTGLNHKIVPERSRNSADLRWRDCDSHTLFSRADTRGRYPPTR